jgi:hypothetical protein
MAAATTNFASIRGKGSEKSGWEAIEALPGMRSCTIESAGDVDDAPPFTLRCVIAEDVDAATAANRREGTKQLLSRCLDASWRAVELPSSERVAVLFSNPKSPLWLEVVQQREWQSKYSVTLQVDAPLPPLTLVRSRAAGATDLDSPVDFRSEKAGVGNVAHAFAELLGADLVIDAGLRGKVTLDRRNFPLHEALDAVCAQVGCSWSFKRSGSRLMLYIRG